MGSQHLPKVRVHGGQTIYMDVTVASSGTSSDAVDASGLTLVGFKTDNSCTGTSMKFQSSDTVDGTFSTLMFDGPTDYEVLRTADTIEHIGVNPAKTKSLAQFVRCLVDTQTGASTIRLYFAPVA